MKNIQWESSVENTTGSYSRYFCEHALDRDGWMELMARLQEKLFMPNAMTPNNTIIDREERLLTSVCQKFWVKFEGIMWYDWRSLSRMTKWLRGMVYNHMPVILPDIYAQHSPKNVEEWFPFPELLRDDLDVFISSMTSMRFVKERPEWVARYGLFNSRVKGQTVHRPWEQDAVRTGFWMLPTEALQIWFLANKVAMSKAIKLFGQIQFAQWHDGTYHMPIHGIYRENPHYPHLRAWSDYLYDVPAEIQYPSGDEIPNYEMTATRVQRKAFQRAKEQNPRVEDVVIQSFENFILEIEKILPSIPDEKDRNDFLVFMLSWYKTSFFHVISPDSDNTRVKNILQKYPFIAKNNKFMRAIHAKDTIQTTDGEVPVEAVIKKYRDAFEPYARSVGIDF